MALGTALRSYYKLLRKPCLGNWANLRGPWIGLGQDSGRLSKKVNLLAQELVNFSYFVLGLFTVPYYGYGRKSYGLKRVFPARTRTV